ncbi:Small integral membrane protein (DUF2273) [Halobacteroides halobius DSM 5150]|uniref:Small integral membrane protein (DUF2273) n=1 Tax=Halobacteroides halobius (strain ATCC 35273 / DSM 5150 / MD-1) TaxID=748449 RepID=L0K837_HALHC|nr:DUF2273 domain-containing protein [Halobacteroides halobius]AGB40519.1 Small integral membrane protein (DUF2273) [Halobacteroides halobius DSM 5150]
MAKFDDLDQLLALLDDYKGRTLGMLIGLFAALLIISLGVIPAIFIMMCMAIGYYFGARYDNRKDFKDVIDKIFPPQE